MKILLQTILKLLITHQLRSIVKDCLVSKASTSGSDSVFGDNSRVSM